MYKLNVYLHVSAGIVPGTLITSTNYPMRYPGDEDVTKIIRFEKSQRIRMTFVEFDVMMDFYSDKW